MEVGVLAREQRKLAAILAADVVGYSRLMGRDESGTLSRLKAHRVDRLEPALARNGGRLVKLTGDGALVEFASAVDALSAAIEFQQAMAEANRDQPEDAAIVFRIGLHLGDLIVDGDDLYGDGVNVAARLESECPPGGIVMSGDVHNAVAGRVKVTFDDLGNLALKNIDRPIPAFRVRWEAADWHAPAALVTRKRIAEKLHSILVLPFSGRQEDETQQLLAEALTDDLTHDLALIPGTIVIAHSSALTLRGKSVDARSAAREFGVRYVVDGSVRVGPERVRINVQLIDTETGAQVWSDRIEVRRSELLGLQDTISGRIAWALELELPSVESRGGYHSEGESADAFELSMQGWSLMNRSPSREVVLGAEEKFRKAHVLDPRLVHARVGLSFTHIRKVGSFWSVSPEADIAKANALIDPALTDAPRHDRAHFVKGLILRAERQLERSSVFYERAIRLNPNYAQALAFLGYNRTLVGRPAECFELIEKARQLSPRDPQLGVWLGFAGTAHQQLREYSKAVQVFSDAVQMNPEYGLLYFRLAAAHVLAGSRENGVAALTEGLRLLPEFSVRVMRLRGESNHPETVEERERTIVALQSIGMPD
jgi:class 3 adenylate cyclase/TolB-like protein